jgi:hypothetical protein
MKVSVLKIAIPILAVLLASTAGAAITTNTAARVEAVRLWGPTGSIRQRQTGTSATWTYESGVYTRFGFETRGAGTGGWAAAFNPLPAVGFRTPLPQEGEDAVGRVMRVGRIQVSRVTDVAPEILVRASENARNGRDAEERLGKFLDAVCSVARQACETAAQDFGVRILP